MPPRAAPRSDGVMRGILLTVVAYFLFAFHDASIKWLVASLPVWQILFCRSLFVSAACLAIGRGKLVRRMLTTPHWRGLALRALLTLVAWLLYYSAARWLQLAQLLTLYYAAPIMVTVLAIPLLGERVGPMRWLGVSIGFAGVLVAANPMGGSFGWPALLVLGAAALWAYALILMRQIARQENSLTVVFSNNFGFLLVTGVASAIWWQPPSWGELALMAGVAVMGGLGQYLLAEGARHAPASVTSTFEYTSLIWAFIIGYVVWNDLPSLAVVLGAALILGAGLLLVFNEHRTARAQRAPAIP